MKKIRKLLRLLLPYLLILLILAAGLCGSFFLIRNAKIYDASIVRHDAPDSRLLFVDAKEPLLLYPWDKIADHDSERYFRKCENKRSGRGERRTSAELF